MQDDAKQGLVDFLEENNIDLVITGTATTSRFRKTLNVRHGPSIPPTVGMLFSPAWLGLLPA